MKVAKLYSFDRIEIEDMPIPFIGPRDALMKTRACGICSGDVMKWYIEKKAPLVFGHEPAGEIIQTGGSVTSFRPGDRVFVHHHAPCMVCHHCWRGDYVQCKTWRESSIVPGGIAEYILIPEINLKHDTLKLPDHISFEAATLIEPAACVVKSMKRSGIRRGDTVLVVGLGVMGILHIRIAKRMGAENVIGADRVGYRLRKGLEAGADTVIDVRSGNMDEQVNDLTGGTMAEIVIIGPNSAEAMMEGLSCVAPGGTVVFFTPARPGETITIDPNELYFKDINIVTSYSCGPVDTREALSLIGGAISPEAIITHRFPIDETDKAFRLTAQAHDSLKCVIVFNSLDLQ